MIDIDDLLWTDRATQHIARHDVTKDEFEEVLSGDRVSLSAKQERVMIIGLTHAGRMLSLVLSPAGNYRYYPITARPASIKERRYYRSLKGGEIAA